MKRLLSLEVHHAVGWLLVIVTLALVGFWVPARDIVDEAGKPAVGGSSYLIFFFHFPSAINCLNFFVFTGILGALYLVRGSRDPRLDLLSTAAAEIGVLACTITLVTGSIWAKAAWNMFWDFRDKRLMTVAVMWFTYVGLLALRAQIEDAVRRARFTAVFSVIATVNVPLVYFSIQIFGKTSHPVSAADILKDPAMMATRWVGAFAFLVLYTALWRLRYRIARLRQESDRLEESLALAGI